MAASFGGAYTQKRAEMHLRAGGGAACCAIGCRAAAAAATYVSALIGEDFVGPALDDGGFVALQQQPERSGGQEDCGQSGGQHTGDNDVALPLGLQRRVAN